MYKMVFLLVKYLRRFYPKKSLFRLSVRSLSGTLPFFLSSFTFFIFTFLSSYSLDININNENDVIIRPGEALRSLEYHSNRAFITNLPFDITIEEIQQHLESAGEIKRIALFRDENKKITGSGFVEYKSPASVDIAIKSFHMMPLRNRNLSIRKDTPPEERRVSYLLNSISFLFFFSLLLYYYYYFSLFIFRVLIPQSFHPGKVFGQEIMRQKTQKQQIETQQQLHMNMIKIILQMIIIKTPSLLHQRD